MNDEQQKPIIPYEETEQERKNRQQFLADLDEISDAGYDDPLDNFPLSPDVKAARAARGLMTAEETRAAVLADREASARYFGWADDTEYLESIPGMVESIKAAASEPISECVKRMGKLSSNSVQ